MTRPFLIRTSSGVTRAGKVLWFVPARIQEGQGERIDMEDRTPDTGPQ